MITSLLDELDDKGSDQENQIEHDSYNHNNINSNKNEYKPSQNNNSESPNDIIVKYTISYRKALDNLKEKNYLSAREQYKTCYELAKTKLHDNVKIIDCLINISICDFYNGEFSLSISNLEQANNIYSSKTNFITPLRKTHLGVKLFANYAISNLTIVKTSSCLDNINTIIIMITKEQNIKKQLSLIHSVIYTLFRLDSLVTTNDLNGDGNYNNNKIISHIIKGFHKFLKDENFDHLIFSFKEASDRYKEIKDMNGFYYALFYQYVAQYNVARNENQINDLKNKVSAVNKFIIGNDISNEVKEKDVEKIMKEFREKAKCCTKIFKMLYALEDELIKKNARATQSTVNNNDIDNNLSRSFDKSHLFTNERISSPIFIKLLLRYSRNFLEEECENNPTAAATSLLNELTLLMSKINNEEIDISKVKLSIFDPEITGALKQLFDNLIILYYRENLRQNFTIYQQKAQKTSRKEYNDMINAFSQTHYQAIRNGSKLIKVNFSSKGVKTHYYKIDTLNETFQIRSKQNDKNPSKSIHLNNEIIKIVYGISTQNIKKKILSSGDKNELALFNYPWRFLSIITEERTIDLYFEDEQLKNWFYGLKFYYSDSNLPYKMSSTNKFVLTLLKFKIVYKLKIAFQNNTQFKDNDPGLKDIVRDLVAEKGIQNFSFIKLFLLYNRLLLSD